MWRRAAAVAALASGSVGGRAQCAKKEPYTLEPNPWGWPLTPNDFDFSDEACWKDKYTMCKGAAQSPKKLTDCPKGTVASTAITNDYLQVPSANVMVSKYMRSVMVKDSNIGKIVIADKTYVVDSVHFVAPSLHFTGEVVAEMFVVHYDQAAEKTEHKFLVTSWPLKIGAENNTLFEQVGIDETHADKESWKAGPVSFQDLPEITDFHSYHGSMPVPPCWETVTWLVSKEATSLTVSQTQVDVLKMMLKHATGADHGRTFTNTDGSCSGVGNSEMPPAPQDPCSLTSEDDMLKTSECWSKAMESKDCGDAKSPVDVPPQAAGVGSPEDLSLAVHYQTVESVTAVPSDYSLDFAPGHHMDFGHLDIHGKQFRATRISVKAVAMHTHDTKIYAGELLIKHSLFGDSLTTGGPQHDVVISIPLKHVIGKSSPMLHALGMGSASKTEEVENGNSYSVQGEFDLAGYVKPLLTGTDKWYWYSGGGVLPSGGCDPDWGVRWIVIKEPLEVSLAQLNTLHLEVSGMDSTRATVTPSTIWQGKLPAYAVDRDGAACDKSAYASYTYEDIHCWSDYTIPDSDNMCGDGGSPIDIKTDNIEGEGSDIFLNRVSWKPVTGLKVDMRTNASLQVHSFDLGYATLYSLENGFPNYYQVTSMSLHMPSEHTVDGSHFAGEFQVAMNKQFDDFSLAADDALIAGFMLKIGKPNHVIAQLVHAVEHDTATTTVDLMQVLGPALEGGFYRYDGSFTTPDLSCADVVKWVLFTTPLEMSQEQVDRFRALIPSPGNNRPIQAANPKPKVYKNMFVEGTLPQYDFYLGREAGRDRREHPTGMILLPVFGSIMLATVVMCSTFVHQDAAVKKEQSGGLISAIVGHPAEKV